MDLKIEKCPLLNSDRIVRLMVNQMLRVQRGEGCLVNYGLFASFKVGNRKVNVGDAWFWVSPLSVSLSLSQLEFWSVDFFWSGPLFRNLSFISFFSSDQIRLVFLCSLLQRSWIGWKITFNHFYFWTNFIEISLCADLMCRNLFFSILKKISAPIISSECSHGR